MTEMASSVGENCKIFAKYARCAKYAKYFLLPFSSPALPGNKKQQKDITDNVCRDIWSQELGLKFGRVGQTDPRPHNKSFNDIPSLMEDIFARVKGFFADGSPTKRTFEEKHWQIPTFTKPTASKS